jgi:hypothetical protein
MKLHFLRASPPEGLGKALESFETQFRYPLGKDGTFSISHGHDYVKFFSAIGEATVVVVEHQGIVLATLAGVLRPLRFPHGQMQTVAYLGDLKVAPSARGGTMLARLFGAMRECLAIPSGGCGYAIVMDGTGSIPPSYTGRLQIPSFEPLSRLTILRISTTQIPELKMVRQIGNGELESIHQKLAPEGAYIPLGGNPTLRSIRTPAALATETGRACGLLEDTGRWKRLLLSDGTELKASHLSRFAYANPADGALLIRQAASLCGASGTPTLFVALPEKAAPAFLSLLSDLAISQIPATVYGCGFEMKAKEWWVDTAEI